MALITRKRQAACKAETTAGTPETLAAGDATINFYDPNITFNIPLIESPQQASSSQGPGVVGAMPGEFTGYTWLTGAGSAADPAWATALLDACGMDGAAGVWTPVTGDTDTSTIQVNIDGQLRKIAGGAGNLVMSASIGERIKMQWRFLGKRCTPTATALLSPTLDTVIAPRFAATVATIGGTAYKLSGFEFDLGNTLTLIEDANDTGGTTSGTGYYLAMVTDRKPTLTLRIMAPGISTHDFHADFVAGTTAAISMVLGTATNNKWTLAAPKAQLMEDPTYDDNGGYAVHPLKFLLQANTSAGDNEFSLTRG